MATKSSLPLADRISTSIKQLAESAGRLNSASDELAKAIAPIDAALKRLNLGVVAWSPFEGDTDHDSGDFWTHDIGYAKVSGKWGLAIQAISGNMNFIESQDEWLFNDAPRSMRIKAVDSIPDLLEALVKKADKVAADIQKKTAHVRDLADTIIAVPTTAQGRK